MAYVPRGGPVPVHPWLLIFRFLQALFAILILATTAYPLSIDGGGPLQPPLISTIIIAILTLIPILPLTTPLHISQRRLYDPRIALVLDVLATLFWLASFAALASYLDIFSDYGEQLTVVDVVFEVCGQCRRAWRSGVAAAVFSAIEFLLFLATTLAFVYYYHCHLAGEPAYGISGRKTAAHDHDNTYGMTSPITGPAIGGVASTEQTTHTETTSPNARNHTGLNEHSPAATVPTSPRGTALNTHPPTSDQPNTSASGTPASPRSQGSGSINGPISPVSISHFPQPPRSNHWTAAQSGNYPPYPTSPSSPPRSPTILERPEVYGVEAGSNVGPGADTARL